MNILEKIIFNQIKENHRLSIRRVFNPDAHTREEYLMEKERVKQQIKNRGKFLKLLLWLKRLK